VVDAALRTGRKAQQKEPPFSEHNEKRILLLVLKNSTMRFAVVDTSPYRSLRPKGEEKARSCDNRRIGDTMRSTREACMVIVKGLALGITLFFVFSVVYLRAWGFFSEKATGLAGLLAVTVGNYLYWIAAFLLLVFGVVAVAIWPVRVSP
jgi:hypothetical protein